MALDFPQGLASNIADLQSQIGQTRAQGIANRGNQWGGYLAGVANLIGQAPQREAQAQRLAAQTAEIQAQQQDRAAAADERKQRAVQMSERQAALAKIYNDPSVRDEAGDVDFDKLSQAVATVDPETAQHLASLAKSHSDVMKSAREQREQRLDRAASLLMDAKTPSQIQAASMILPTIGLSKDEGEQIGQILDQGPEAIQSFVNTYSTAARTAKAKAAEQAAAPYTLNLGDVRFEGGAQVASNPKPPAEMPKPPSVGTFEDYVGRTYGPSPTPKQLLQARKEWNQADDKATGFATGDVTKLDPGAIDLAALNYKRTGVMPPLGMGDKSNRQAILNRAAALTPEDAKRIESGGGDIAANKANYAADAGSLKKLQAQRDAIGAFEKTAQKNIDIFLKTAEKVVDTGSPLANALARNVSAQALGSPDQSAFDAARQVAINEIAKITSNPNLSGTLSDSARHEVEAFNPRTATLKQSVAVMRVLKQDMANRITALDEALDGVKSRIGIQAPQATTPPPGAKVLKWDGKKFVE